MKIFRGKMSSFFKLLRWPNLLIIALVQYFIRFFIIESLDIPHVLNHLEFFAGVLCSISLAAAGYVINDIYDQQTDRINKPGKKVLGNKISVNSGWTIYGIFNIIAIISGYYLAQVSGLPDLWLIPVVAIALLYLYAIDLKKRAVLGNLSVSLLTALPVLLVGVFDILPAATTENAATVKSTLEVIGAYAAFAFFTNFIREMIKDAEDVEGDRDMGYRTLAVILGRRQTSYIIIILLLILVVFTGYYNAFLFASDKYSATYLLLFVNIPILFLVFKIFRARHKEDFYKASIFIKVVMLTGILSMAIFTLSLKAQML